VPKLLILLALTILISLPAVNAYCAGSMTLVVSATLPSHVMDNNALLQSNNADQLVQTQTIIKNNKSFVVTSIVLP